LPSLAQTTVAAAELAFGEQRLDREARAEQLEGVEAEARRLILGGDGPRPDRARGRQAVDGVAVSSGRAAKNARICA
jgi:hypothetical protein